MIGTPHTTKVRHTFPLVTLGFKCNKLEFEHCAKKVYFFIFLNSLGNTHVTTGERLSGGTSTQPQPRVRVRAQGNTVNPPKTQV